MISFTWKYPLWSVNSGHELKPGEIVVDGEVVHIYATNDGGYWYSTKDGRVIIVDD